MNRKSNVAIISIFIIFIIAVNSLNIFSKDRPFSETENRMLAQKPDLTWKSIRNGRFTMKFEEYITDQFIFRDFWVGLKSDSERLLLKQDNNDVFFGKDGYLFKNYHKPNKNIIANSIRGINYFQTIIKDMKTYVLLAPTSIKVNEEKLPPYATPHDELLTLSNIENNLTDQIDFINVFPALREKNEEYLYYKTDHHWTMRGAYYAYVELAKTMGITPYSLEDFNNDVITKDFYGTLYSKANNYHLKPDYIEVFTPKKEVNLDVYYMNENKTTNSLFEDKHLNTKDKYSYFLDGNQPLVTIKSDVNNGEKLIIFKNSYSHCFIPFLVNHYEEIHVIDLRFYRLNVYDYIRENNISNSLFLYDILNFSKDDSIRVLEAYQ